MMKAYFDGACRGNPGHASWACAVFDGGELIYKASATIPGMITNNYAEYTGLLMLLKALSILNLTHVEIFGDSKLVVNQVRGEWKCASTTLKEMCLEATALLVRGYHNIHHIKGHDGNSGNELVDQLCNEVLDKEEETWKLQPSS